MNRWVRAATVGLIVAVLAGCAQPSAPGPSRSGEPAVPAAPKALTIALPGEPANLAIPGMGDVPTGSTGGGDVKFAVHHRLATYDDRGELHPMLARELPTQAAGTWVVRPDGSMQTTYRLRPDVFWHDGTPLTTRDFAFSLEVVTDPKIPVSTRLGSLISRLETPDEHTLVYEWSSTYPFANALVDDEAAPLPSHLLRATYQTDKERFLQLGYWTREFVGTGPFRLAEWEPSSHMTLRAFDRFYAGKPPLDTLTFRFIPEPGTVVANLLAGSVDGALSRAIDFNQALLVKREWERAGKQSVYIPQTTHWRLLEVQLRPELVRPRSLLDPRVRRGLLHAIDRQALADVLLEGQAPPSDVFLPTDDAKWDWVKDVVTRYDFDQRRAQAVLMEAGWRREADGGFTEASGERVTLNLTTRPGDQAEQEIAIIADQWKAIGAATEQVVLSTGQARDNRVISTFPAFAPTSNPLAFENTMQVVYGPLCSSEATRWAGRNHGCYLNPEWDRLVDGLRSTIDPNEQRRLWRELARIYTQDLPVLPLYFNIQTVIFRAGVLGVRGDTRPRTSPMWNAQEWDVSGT